MGKPGNSSRFRNHQNFIKKSPPPQKELINKLQLAHRGEKWGTKVSPNPEKNPQTMSSKTKIYILDSTVFLHDKNAIINLKDNHIHMPITVYDELDDFKKDMGELGTNSRYISNFLKEILGDGEFKNGIPLKTGGKLFIDTENDIRSFEPLKNHRDNASNRILAVALKKQKEFPNNPVIVISNNPSILIKASAYGIRAEEYKNDQVEIYEGFKEIKGDKGLIDVIKKNGRVSCPLDIKMVPNEFAIIKHGPDTIETIHQGGSLVQLHRPQNNNVFGIMPKNPEQELALQLLLDPNIDIVTITGEAGTGKTLLALAAAFEQVRHSKIYSRIAVARPTIPMGRDIGFFPGTVEEKLRPWMQPIFDALDFIFRKNKAAEIIENTEIEIEIEKKSSQKKKPRKEKARNTSQNNRVSDSATIRKHRPSWQNFIDSGLLIVEPLCLMRGRTLPRQFLIIDEAQNLTGPELKMIITRAGYGTKIVLTGDIEQIDNIYLNRKNNGLSVTIHRLKESDVSGHISLKEVCRSRLAALGAIAL